jgi:membrane fusion protein (multidrug efflux system)
MFRAVVVVLLVAAGGCKKSGDASSTNKPPPAPPVKVTAAIAGEAPAPEVLTLTGIIAANQRAEVTADTQGKVIDVMVARGDRVKFGQPVVRLDVRSAALSAREAQANLAGARAQKDLADQECARTKTLLEKGAITQSEYDRQMTQCRAALEQVSATQARTEMMVKSVSDGLVRAPFAGMVAEKNVSPGEWVAPGKPLFTLVDDDPLKIELSVPEAAVDKIALKARVEVEAVAYPGKKHGATVTRVGAEIGRTRSLIVEATLDKGSNLVPGMFAEAHVILRLEQRVVVPKAAVATRGKQHHVFVVKNGEVVDSIVHLGYPPDGDHESILSGLAKGDKFVTAVIDEPKSAPAGSGGSAAPTTAPKGMELLGDGVKVTESGDTGTARATEPKPNGKE